jgi:hypothetical protein
MEIIMSLGYVEELALRYFRKKGYLVHTNIWFQLKKERTRKKVAGWSDIDMLALTPEEVILVQCKSFLGQKKSESIANELIAWFENAEDYLNNDASWKAWINGRNIKRCLVVDSSVKKTEKRLKEKDIQVMYYSHVLSELIRMLRSPDIRKGKEDDSIIRLLCALIDKDLLKLH